MKYHLKRWKSHGLNITVDGVKRDYDVFKTARTRVGAGQDLKTAKVINGLTKEEEEYFEKEMGLEKGTLSVNSKFWRTWGVWMSQGGTYLDDEITEDALAVKVLSARDNIALSTHEAKTQLRAANSPIEYVLTNIESEADATVEKTTYTIQAVTLLGEMNIEQMREYLVMTGVSPYSMSDKLVKSRVSEIALNDSKKFVEMCTDANKKELIFINELVNYTILKKFGAQFLSPGNPDPIAFNMQDMIMFIKNPENSKQVAGLKKELAIKKREA